MNRTTFSRRRFLQAMATASGGLMLAFHLPGARAADWPHEDDVDTGNREVNAWLIVNADNTVLIRVGQSEMGQGVFTAMPMIVAEELEADFALVRAEYADANRHLRENELYKRMSTGGSGAVRRSIDYLQRAGAEARERLIRAGAARWGVPPAECHARAGYVRHEATGRNFPFGALAVAAAAVDLGDAPIALKKPADFTLLGTSPRRLDTPGKVDGSTVFGADVRVPGMVFAAIRHCPVIGGTLRSHDASAIAGRRGVLQTVALDNAVAVVADSTWRAQQALAALPVEWDMGAGAGASSAAWETDFLAALDAQDGAEADKAGDPDAAFAAAAKRIRGDYLAPYLAHACMEPMNCTVSLQADRLDVWVGHQNPPAALQAAAEASGLTTDRCHVHTCHLGGGFGRRSQADVVREAVMIARAVGKPVQLVWSREEDTRQGWFRPLSAIRFDAALDDKGAPAAFSCHSVTHSILADLRPEAVATGVDRSSVEGLAPTIYSFADRRSTHRIRNTHLTTWFWRAVGASQNGWALESFIDELALAADADPLAFRKSLLRGRKDCLGVLDKLADVAQWGREMPAGSAQGLALFESFGSVVGQVAEVSITPAGALSVDRFVSVVDCGNVVHPGIVETQVESAIVYGLTAALYGQITVADGVVQEGNFDTYPMLRMADTPRMETHLALSGGGKWGGIGEPGLPPVAAAVCNAIHRITGKRLRTLPIARHDLSWS